MLKKLGLNQSDVDNVLYVKVSFLPRKSNLTAYSSVALQYECSRNIEAYLGTDFVSFLNFTLDEWKNLTSLEGQKKDLNPIFWRMFTPESGSALLKHHLGVFFKDTETADEEVCELKLWAVDGQTTNCKVAWHTEMYPLIDVIESIAVLIQPLEL
jgi:hypothetical protein